MDQCHVTGTVLDAARRPVTGTIEFVLTARDHDGAAVLLPEPVRARIGPDGQVAVDLWPNARGHAGTNYIVKVVAEVGNGVLRPHPPWRAVVPEATTASLTDIAELVPPKATADALAAAIDARAARAAAKDYRDQAEALHDDMQPAAAALIIAAANIDSVNTVAARAAEIATVAAAAADIHTVASRDAAIATVAALDAAIVTVADRAAAVTAVAAIAPAVTAVAAAQAAVQTAAANVAAIQAAPGAAAAAASARDAAQGHAAAAADSAALVATAAMVEYGVSIYADGGIEPGVYSAERRAALGTVRTRLFAEIVAGDAGAEATLSVIVAGTTAAGPVTVAAGAPLDLGGLAIAIPPAATIDFLVDAQSGGITEVFCKTYGAQA